MRILFLDFDGVASTDEQRVIAAKRRLPPAQHLCKPLVQRVNQIVTATNAQVVASTNWRIEYSKEALSQILKDAGATFTLLSTTPTSPSTRPSTSSSIVATFPTRGHEIEAWLEGWIEEGGEEVEGFVILDDLPRYEFDHFGRQHLISTDPTIGLTDVGVQRAIRVMMTPNHGFRSKMTTLVT